MKKVDLSVNTIYYRYLNPFLIIISIAALVYFFPRKNVSTIGICIATLIVSTFLLIEKRKVLSVQFYNNNLIISNYLRKDIVPIEKVNHVVIEGSGLNQRAIIEFKEDVIFGRKIYFSPKEEITTINQKNHLYKKILKIDEYIICN